MATWSTQIPGVVVLPDGRRIRGRSLRHDACGDAQRPDFGVYLTAKPYPPQQWESRWIRWPDFRLPHDAAAAISVLREAHERAEHARVEIACDGGTGRTGTAIALLARMAGVDPAAAVTWTRAAYRGRAVETWWQRRFVARTPLGRSH